MVIMPEHKPEPEIDRAHPDMGEEFDRAKWTLPPLGLVAGGVLFIAVLVGLLAWRTQPKPVSAGSIDDVFAVASSDNQVLATIRMTVRNAGQRPLYIKGVKVSVKTDQGENEDDAASPDDFDRYFQAFPALKDHSIKPMRVETKLPAGLQDQGSVIVGFPLTLDQFNARKSLTVIVDLYDNKPLVITK